jgi:hypothetical protein
MYQRALQDYEKAIGPDNIITYVPALNTIWGFGSVFESQDDLAKARTMFSKALRGHEQVFGPDHAKSEILRKILCALDAVMKSDVLIDIEDRADDLHLGPIKKPPLTSKWCKLLRKLGLRY